MIRVRLSIAGGGAYDTADTWGLVYLSADNCTEAPIKKRDVTAYIEEAGQHTDPRTVQDAFDYKVRFIIDGQDTNLDNINSKIAAFNRALFTQAADSDIRVYKEVAFYNDFRRVKIVGIPDPIAEPKEMFRTKGGCDSAEVEWVIHVDDPTKCNFNLTNT